LFPSVLIVNKRRLVIIYYCRGVVSVITCRRTPSDWQMPSWSQLWSDFEFSCTNTRQNFQVETLPTSGLIRLLQSTHSRTKFDALPVLQRVS